MMIMNDWCLPPATEDDTTETTATIAAPVQLSFEPVGRWYEALCRRRLEKHGISYHSLKSSSSEEEEDDLEEQDDEPYLMTLDPKEWRKQDHYNVLGLAEARYRASDDDIKKAYKRKVLRHHPDKRRARGIAVKEEEADYFTCITRAWETLGNRSKRKSFDSVDPEFDDSVPSSTTEAKDFFRKFCSAFERNARWSTRKPVPQLGKADTKFDLVNRFYKFWYDFDSWREYSYLDEEEKEKGENRDERRWIEKQNKAARKERKKEETTRLRQIVDNAYDCDPRIINYKDEQKRKKEADKQAKRDAIKARQDEEERVKREAEEVERKKREAEEEAVRAHAAVIKKEKEAQKKAVKNQRKTFRTKVKEYDYFGEDDADRLRNMTEVDRLAEMLSLTQLQELNTSLTSGDPEKAKAAFKIQVKEATAQLEEEKRQQISAAQKSTSSSSSSSNKAPWGDEEMTFLIKAVNLFPAGTNERWETVSNFITQHVPSSKRSAKEVLSKAKELQRLDPNQKDEANKKAFHVFAKDASSPGAAEKSELSQRFDSVAIQQIGETGTNPAPWSADEQKLLEQSLRTYPASTAERWEKIAVAVGTRSKKDCMIRYKELVEMVKAKKAAQAAVKGKK